MNASCVDLGHMYIATILLIIPALASQISHLHFCCKNASSDLGIMHGGSDCVCALSHWEQAALACVHSGTCSFFRRVNLIG